MDGQDTRGASNPVTPRPSFIYRLLHFFGGGIYAPDSSTYDPIETLLNAEDPEERDRLTERWRDNRLDELSFVGVVAALLAGVLTSTGSWPNITSGEQDAWHVRTSWYCGIILSLFSLLTAADQTVRLHRMSSHRNALNNIRNLLAMPDGKRRRSKSTHRLQPKTSQVYAWQLPVIFLTTATLAMIVGMFLHVWNATKDLQWADPNFKVALIFTVVAVLSIGGFFAGQASMYVPDNEVE
ncbi:hypothetical protein K505DRAFT_248971 [Melanomma pulvis-pyrius CBS 109.77]|uniref:Uncharacterized protein n=1 Tax=Melanomma pulvis-pyrius CBS 109.77 TaxID=1314802 RepID=A0A6A6X4Y5_9PLEO|nr:hypothetical protein K505DRAFT_248971 [Melanomma pulvis-pyrius CBS 109.77]